MARDVTRAVEAERALRDVQERYALLAENVQDMISLHDTDGTFLYASPSAVSVLGYHPVEIVGRTVYDLVDPEDVAMLRAAHAAIMKREGRGPALFRARHRDGSQRWMETAARMVEHPETGEPWRIVGATRDISERRSFERHLMQSQKMEALGRLAGGIAHDFNNALTVIGGHADLLMTQLGDAPTRKQAEYIREAALRASALTSQLQSFGRSAPQEMRVLDANALILEMQPLLLRVLGADVTLTLELDPKLRTLRADPTSLRQVLMNLAVNSREAMPPERGGGHVSIITQNTRLHEGEHASLPAGDYVAITVGDDGRGMPAAVSEHIFEPFYTTKHHVEGAGLGLSAAYAEVRGTGGDISVESTPGAGTAVTLLLPSSELAPSWTPEDRVVTEDLSGTETILVAEDDAGVRSLIVATLERHGYSVMTAVDGRQALEVFRTYGHLVDLIVTDVNMPELSGPELARNVAETHPDLAVLFISGFTSDAIPFSDAENRSFLPKPFTPVQLAQSVSRCLTYRR
jgi:two-component system, cell cycle sensor histidine kinase and response regulator CckA